MNDLQIRRAFHHTFLDEEHKESSTLILDELGLKHGKCRADIAVISGHLNGYEIKSDSDSLYRLRRQVESYNAVFDYVSVVLTYRHLNEAMYIVPEWWGVILVTSDQQGDLNFQTIRLHDQNEVVNNYAVAQLLWRQEAQEVLINLGVQGNRLREKRSNLYNYIVEMLNSQDLRFLVRNYLKKRKDWRRPEQPFLCDG
jgi:hypothetical protein